MPRKIRSKDPVKWKQARELRKSMSVGEKILWEELRYKITGVKFRRQAAIGPYILDFYCPEIRLCVEVDGEQHEPGRDAIRDRYMAELGIMTWRTQHDVVDGGARSVAVDQLYLIVQARQRELDGKS